MDLAFSRRRLSVLQLLFLILGFGFFPFDVLAWGPVAHIDISMQILSGAVALAPVTYSIIRKYAADFVYGSLAADATVGKNMARDETHCHSWAVGRTLLKEARKKGERCEAFMLGYMSHLGADVVAHNQFVPERIVSHFDFRGVGHLYWEARFDRRILNLKSEVQKVWCETGNMRFSDHDRFLARRIVPTFFSNRLSGRIYRGSLGMQQRAPWQVTLKRIDTHSKLRLSDKDAMKWRGAALAMAGMAIEYPFSKELSKFDPTGRARIHAAVRRRKTLRLRAG